jgi:hypothetical protein
MISTHTKREKELLEMLYERLSQLRQQGVHKEQPCQMHFFEALNSFKSFSMNESLSLSDDDSPKSEIKASRIN